MISIKTKSQAREIFGTYKELAGAIGISKQALQVWPEQLTSRQSREILGTAIETGRIRCVAFERCVPGQEARRA